MTARKSKGVVPREDHRVRVAGEKRERMRDHLLGAVLAVYPGKPGQGPAVIDDVIRVAKVSRGTFYKYYPSLEEAVAELGAKLAAEWWRPSARSTILSRIRYNDPRPPSNCTYRGRLSSRSGVYLLPTSIT
jgi:AcrR family transcriptional regulator